MPEENQTPKTQPGTGEELKKELQTGEPGQGTEKGTETGGAPSKPEGEDWKQKFSDSFRETERYRKDVVPNLERQLETERTSRQKIEKEQNEFLKILEQDKPDMKKLLDLERKIAKIEQDNLSVKEATQISDFIRRHPEAEKFKTILKSLGRTNPNMGYDQIWTNILAPSLETSFEERSETAKGARKRQPETGKGSRTTTEKGEIDDEAFRKLPLEKREKILKKRLEKEGRGL